MEELGIYQADIGINRIARVGTPPMELPSRRETELTGQPIRQQIDELFPAHRMEQAMRDFASPVLRDRSVILPRRFYGLLRESADALQQSAGAAAGQARDPGVAVSPGGDPSAVGRAAALMRDEVEKLDLLHQYRVSLMPA